MDERDSSFDHAFFQDPPEAPKPRETIRRREQKVSLDAYRGSCAPEWLTFSRAVIFLAGVTVGGGKLLIDDVTARQEAIQQQIQKDHLEAVEARSEQLFEAEMLRIEGAFKDGAQTLREHSAFKEEFSKEFIDVFAEEFERFPARQIFVHIAEQTGKPLHEIAADNRVRVVELYSNAHVKTFVSRFESETGQNHDDKEAAKLALGRAGVNVTARAILLNASEIAVDVNTSEELRRRVQDVLIHEFLHGFDGTAITAPRSNAFYEGWTEALANRLGKIVYPNRGEKDPFAGYVDGSTVAAELVLASTEDDAGMWKSYLQGNVSALGHVFDTTHGTGAFSRALAFDQNKGPASSGYEILAPVLGILHELGEDAPSVIEDVNARLSTGRLFTIDLPGAESSVFLVGDGAPSGILNSAVRFEKEDHVSVARFVSSESSTYVDDGGMLAEVYLYGSLWEEGESSLDVLPPEEIKKRLHALIEKESSDLALLSE